MLLNVDGKYSLLLNVLVILVASAHCRPPILLVSKLFFCFLLGLVLLVEVKWGFDPSEFWCYYLISCQYQSSVLILLTIFCLFNNRVYSCFCSLLHKFMRANLRLGLWMVLSDCLTFERLSCEQFSWTFSDIIVSPLISISFCLVMWSKGNWKLKWFLIFGFRSEKLKKVHRQCEQT